MPTYPLPYRITDFLQRQIAWAEQVLRELDAFCALPDDADLDEEEARQVRRERETRAMTREYNGLVHEWQAATDIDGETRAEITALSARAQALLGEVRRGYARAGEAAARMKGRNRQAANDLRRGRRSVNIYRPGLSPAPGFIDKEA